MRAASLFAVALVICVVAVSAADVPEISMDAHADEFNFDATSFLEVAAEMSSLQVNTVPSYVPSAGPWDNPSTDVTPTPTLPHSPQCTIRGQTVLEIRKMRADAKQIGMAIMYEIQTMEKRKAYIERMTTYLNDRIRELNKVKSDLRSEQKWIELSNQRIAELAEKEKMIKLTDVMSCIKAERERLAGDSAAKANSLQSLDAQAQTIAANIRAIENKVKVITSNNPLDTVSGLPLARFQPISGSTNGGLLGSSHGGVSASAPENGTGSGGGVASDTAVQPGGPAAPDNTPVARESFLF